MEIHETLAEASTSRTANPSPAHSDCHSYLAQAKFHRSFTCSRTGLRGTYADLGDPSGTPVVYFLPSGCSRYISFLYDEIAGKKGVRIVAMDRPGSGGADKCDLNQRVRVTCEMTESLIEHLNLGPVSLLGLSGGSIHMLEYLRLHPERLSPTQPTALLISPWVPGNIYLPIIPTPLITYEHKLLPSLLPVIEGLGNAFSTVKSVLSASSASFPSPGPQSEDSTSKGAKREMLSYPYPGTHKAMMQQMWAEEQQGIAQEHLLCLGKGVTGDGAAKIGSRDWVAKTITEIKQPAQPGKENVKLYVHIWWGLEDGMVPHDARDFLDNCLVASPSIEFQRTELPNADHNIPAGSLDGIGAALDVVRTRAEVGGWQYPS